MAIIMISRGTFSGGKAVAEAVAQRLNYTCVSNEILFDAAEQYKVPEERLNTALSEPPRTWRHKPGMKVAHINFGRATLLTRAKEASGNIVYHGNAGHMLLTDLAQVIRVRIVANREYRIEAAMTERGVDRKKAEEIIAKDDRRIMKWTQGLYGVDWQEPSLYDVVLNLEHMCIESAVEMIVRITELPDYTPTPEARQAFEDLLLASLVWAELTKNQFTRSADVRVTADRGVITVSGKATSHKIIDMIPLIAQEVPGVKEVRSEVGVGSDWMW
jgi:cytidylate kinase